jgi:hypothetical protein
MVGEETAIAAAQNCRIFRARGITVRRTIDTLTATFGIARELFQEINFNRQPRGHSISPTVGVHSVSELIWPPSLR